MQEPLIPESTSVADLLKQHPESARIFVRHRMACVGCEMACFETIESAARIYQVPLDILLRELNESFRPGRKK